MKDTKELIKEYEKLGQERRRLLDEGKGTNGMCEEAWWRKFEKLNREIEKKRKEIAESLENRSIRIEKVRKATPVEKKEAAWRGDSKRQKEKK